MIYCKSEMDLVRESAKELKLDAPRYFWIAPLTSLMDICNGFGSDAFPENLRKVLDWVYRNYKEIAAIHDVDYELSDGTEEQRKIADDRFLKNGLIMWQDIYGWSRWINPVAIYSRHKIYTAHRLLRAFGKGAWLASYERKKER